MPRDVAVEGPHTRVVSFYLHDHVGRNGGRLCAVQDVNVATLRVLRVDDVAVPFAVAFREDVHVVAVVVETVAY